jgi:hypothetical protein
MRAPAHPPLCERRAGADAGGDPTLWIVIKCQFADDASTAGATPILDELFTANGAGNGGMAGWHRMSMTLESAGAERDVRRPGVRAERPGAERRQPRPPGLDPPPAAW